MTNFRKAIAFLDFVIFFNEFSFTHQKFPTNNNLIALKIIEGFNVRDGGFIFFGNLSQVIPFLDLIINRRVKRRNRKNNGKYN